MNDNRMFDLAMKVIARQCSDAERAEFEAHLSRQPELRAEFERLEADVRLAKEALPLVDAAQASAGELPGYARARLQTKVRQTLGRPEPAGNEPDRSLAWGWRWWLGLAAAATAVVVLVLGPLSAGPKVQVQLAVLDLAGATRGGETNQAAALTETWPGAKVEAFSETAGLEAWEKTWPPEIKGVVAKVVYDCAAAEVRVSGRARGVVFTNRFSADSDLRGALAKAKAYVEAQVGR